MAEQTGIEWCDATFNPWWGCEKISPGCAHCYADTLANRRAPGRELWGAGHELRLFGDAHWADPLKWARYASQGLLPDRTENRDGHRPRIFCASMADVFEERPELEEPRVRLMMLIEQTPALDWLVLTKRPEFARDWLKRWYDAIARGNFPEGTRALRPYRNMWLGVSIENSRFTWRADVLRKIPAAVRFISAEPLLGSLFASAVICGRCLDLEAELGTPPTSCDVCAGRGTTRAPLDLRRIDWVIVGGESGAGAREMNLDWARELAARCGTHCCGNWATECCGHPLLSGECCGDGVTACCQEPEQDPAVFVKQLGAVVGKQLGAGGKGQLLDAFPYELRRREFPTSTLNRSVAA